MGQLWGPTSMVGSLDCQSGVSMTSHRTCAQKHSEPQQSWPFTTACRQLYSIELQLGNVWELDSSQPNKFSRHIVVCLRQAAFACSAVVGAFVAQLLALPEVGCVSTCQCTKLTCQSEVLWGFWLSCTESSCLSSC